MSLRGQHTASAITLPCFLPGISFAHSFDTPYVPPIPLWMYVYGCAATLIVTFAILSLFVTRRDSEKWMRLARRDAPSRILKVPAQYLYILRSCTLILFIVAIIAGLLGGDDPERNIATVAFWVIFLLVFAYATALFGNIFPLINPWAAIIAGLERLGLDLSKNRVHYPRWLSYWPPLVFYMTLVWIELFAPPLPRTVSVILLGYTIATLIGVALLGKSTWFTQVDFFSVYFRLIGKLAPVEHERPERGIWQLRLRAPFSGTRFDQPRDLSIVLFVLFMLASTTYDSIHETALWTGLFWKNLLVLLQPLWGTDIQKAQELLMGWYLLYRQAGLVVFPFLYLAIYLIFAGATAAILHRGSTVITAFAFCYSLLPIALSYHFTHYFPFLVSLADNFLPHLSDPFGLGWTLVPVPSSDVEAPLPMGLIWHTQVGVLLLGHLASIYLAHVKALESSVGRSQLFTSQLPLLVLMVIYTISGLWILSLPLAAE